MASDRYLALAIPCKVLAIFWSVVVGLFIFRPRWGLNSVADAQVIGLAILSLIPNRTLVSTRVTFLAFLLLSLFPFRVFFAADAYRGFGIDSVIGMLLAFVMFGPLPLSLALSRRRFLRGKNFLFA
jgi:hypothetical protein